MDIGRRVAELRQTHVPVLTQDYLAERTSRSVDTIRRIEQGTRDPSLSTIESLAEALGVPVAALFTDGTPGVAPALASDGEMDALELSQRVAASDVGAETLSALEDAADRLARAYPVSRPAELVGQTSTYLRYVVRLIDAKKTLEEHRRLLVVGSWLSLIAGTLYIDLEQSRAANASLRTALDLGRQTSSPDVVAWCFETRAWAALTDGNYRDALSLSLTAQEFAPAGSSILIQATAQEGRAQARLKNTKGTYAALDRVQRLVDPLATPEHPEHHFTYDPNKATAYFGTTLAWVGDPAAESYAREVIARLDGVNGWPRRVASARLDLGLALLAADKHDEAASLARQAVESGRVVPSNRWRVLEVVRAVEARGLPEAKDLREAYRDSQS